MKKLIDRLSLGLVRLSDSSAISNDFKSLICTHIWQNKSKWQRKITHTCDIQIAADKMPIKRIHARQIFDSRGNPTIEVDVTTELGD